MRIGRLVIWWDWDAWTWKDRGFWVRCFYGCVCAEFFAVQGEWLMSDCYRAEKEKGCH